MQMDLSKYFPLHIPQHHTDKFLNGLLKTDLVTEDIIQLYSILFKFMVCKHLFL